MNKKIKKLIKTFRSLPGSVFYLFGGTPAGYWEGLLLFFAALFTASVVLGIYMFVTVNNLVLAEAVISEERRTFTIDRAGLDRAVQVIDAREQEFIDALFSPPKPDPSI